MATKPRYPLDRQVDKDNYTLDDTVYSWYTSRGYETNLRTCILNHYAHELIYHPTTGKYIRTIINDLHKRPTWRDLLKLIQTPAGIQLENLRIIRGVGPTGIEIINEQFEQRRSHHA